MTEQVKIKPAHNIGQLWYILNRLNLTSYLCQLSNKMNQTTEPHPTATSQIISDHTGVSKYDDNHS